MSGKRKYLCTGCGREKKAVDMDNPDTIRSGCPRCEAIRRWVAYGSSALIAYSRRRRSRA